MAIDFDVLALELGQLKQHALSLRDRMRKAGASWNSLALHAMRFEAIDDLIAGARLAAESCASVERSAKKRASKNAEAAADGPGFFEQVTR